MVLNTSTNDPVFFNHHSQIDRLWSMWEDTHGMVYEPTSGLPDGQNLNDTMWPFNTIGDNTTIADLLDISTLGYVYA
jgi:tyrosinase